MTKKITQLPIASTLDGSEKFELVQGGISKQSTINDVLGGTTNKGKGYIADTALVDTLPGGATTYAGNFFRRTVASTSLTSSDGVSLLPIGLIEMARIDNPSSSDVSDWIFLNSF